MPRAPKKNDNRTTGETVPSQFRLAPGTMADLDAIASALTEETGVRHSRADAVRFSARQTAKKILKKTTR